MLKRFTIWAQILVIFITPLLLLGGDTQQALASDRFADKCGDLKNGAEKDPGADDKFSITGGFNIGGIIAELEEAAADDYDDPKEKDSAEAMLEDFKKLAKTDGEKLTVKLYIMGTYAGDGSGTPYCVDTTTYVADATNPLNDTLKFRFDGVYPGQYQLVVYDAKKDLFDSFFNIACTAGTSFLGFVITPGSFLQKAIGGMIGGAAGEFLCAGDVPVFTAHVFADKKKENGYSNIESDDEQLVLSNHLPISVTYKKSMTGIITMLMFIANGLIIMVVNFFADLINEKLLIIDNLTKIDAVVIAWANVRDAANILLLIALLIIAFANAARFQIEAYAAKLLIPKLIIGAILINFSLFITQVIIDFSNMLTVFFMGNDGIHFYHLLPFTNDGYIVMVSGGAGGFLTTIGGAVVGFFFGGFIALMTVIASFTVVLILAVRIALLWAIAIFSPIVFLFGILPFTRGLLGMWWKYLIQYAFMGPVMALLLYVASNL